MDISSIYPPFPYISMPNYHSVKIEWFDYLDELALDGANCSMEITIKKKADVNWERIYLGTGSFCYYEYLNPSTEYELRLRTCINRKFGPYGPSEYFETLPEPDSAFDLHKAIKQEDVEALTNLLNKSIAKLEVPDLMDYTPLMAAVSRNNKIIIQMIINAGASVNTANKLKKTPLMLASNKGFIDTVELLIKRQADVEMEDINGMTAIFYAVDGEYCNVIRALIRAGANVNHTDNDSLYTPLIRLACLANNGNSRVGATLMDCGANVNHKDKFGQTALIHCAFHRNHTDLAKTLLQYGADPDIVNKKKNTALEIAKSVENVNFCQLLESLKKKKVIPRMFCIDNMYLTDYFKKRYQNNGGTSSQIPIVWILCENIPYLLKCPIEY